MNNKSWPSEPAGEASGNQGRPAPDLLLVEDESATRKRLQSFLAAQGFAVTTAGSLGTAEQAAAERSFDFAVIDTRLSDGHGLDLVKSLQQQKAPPRIIVISGHDSFASAVLALRAGAVDYLPKPIDGQELIQRLRGEAVPVSVPETPLSADRVRWEYIQRLYEQCDRNVSETARRLGMHRRTLQRIMSKRAPRPRG